MATVDDLSLSNVLKTLLTNEPELLSIAADSFPIRLWQRLAEEKLLIPSLSVALGGQGSRHPAIIHAVKVLTYASASPGLGMTWVMQQALIELIIKSDNELVNSQYLTKLLSGEALCALSVSEPGAGAHPKRLTTTAEYRDGAYVINGEKTYVTNGPFAGLFIVLAITEMVNGRKAFTAFMVPRETKGLTVKPMKGFDALKPSQHCGLVLDNCRLPASHIIGEKGHAFDSISKPFREHEDVLMLSALAGAMQSITDEIITLNEDILTEELGQLLAIIDSVMALAVQAAMALDEGGGPLNTVSYIIVGRGLVEKFNHKINKLLVDQPLTGTIKRLIGDIDVLVNIAKMANVSKQKALAMRYLANRAAL